MERKRILVVDDEASVRELICDALELAGYSVTAAADGIEASSILHRESIDLLLTDVNMPRRNGYELVKSLRDRGDLTPVIFLTARNEKPDISTGFKLGADDYVSKPFGLEELTLRISAILRRTNRGEITEQLICGPISLDTDTHRVTLDGEFVDLSPTEFRLLSYLMENKNKVLTKHALLDTVWDLGFAASTSVVDTFISYLRKKLHKSGFAGIVTVRGIGFKISDRP
jgi:two-component system OmpR family response regulator